VVPLEPHKFQKHDIVTIIVREDSTNTSTGQAKSEKKQDFDLALEQYLKFSLANLSLGTTSPTTSPEIKFKYDNNRQNNANTQRTDSTALRISATVVDVKPNGNLVIEATKQITMDREIQDYTLSGMCRSEDVSVDNTLLSTQLADLKLKKTTSGEVRDGTRRGWLNSLIDRFGAF
jgi:flagellar L-ring protein precursor FlgH